MDATTPSLYPLPSEAALKLQYVGKQIQDIPAPAVIIDRAIARRNCTRMLETAAKLGLGFRAHVKTHKTTELTSLQVGADAKDIRLIVSTVAEAENLLPYLLERRNAGCAISVLYGLPLTPSAAPRLARLARLLGPGSIGVFADHPEHVKLLAGLPDQDWPGQIPVFVKIDTGYHRAGVEAESKQLADLAYALAGCGRTFVKGFYAHMGHSYSVSGEEEAVAALGKELQGLEEAAVAFLKCSGADVGGRGEGGKVCLSLGATPTATAAQNFLSGSGSGSGAGGEDRTGVRAMLAKANESFEVELHAGVYPVMDLQQMATGARPKAGGLGYQDLGLRTLVEVASVYEERAKPEAVIAAGCIVLGREPCKSYPGFGVVTPFPQKLEGGSFYDPEGEKTGWIVGRLSQEHGILTWEGPVEGMRKLAIGEKLLVWPNHACIAGVSFGWYLVVDSEAEDPMQVQDVWVRWRGW